MSPFSWPVLGCAAVVGSPALWAAFVTHTLSPDAAALRMAICLVIAWVALSIFAALTGGEEQPAAPETQRPADVDLG